MGECSGANTLVRPYAPPERRGESCIRPLCPIRSYAQKLRLHRAILFISRSALQMSQIFTALYLSASLVGTGSV